MISLNLIEPKKVVTGAILYEGPSQINEKPIVAIAVGLNGSRKSNTKTGDAIQIYLLNKNIHPAKAVFESKDSSICGNCIHRFKYSGSCYVNVANGPSAVWQAYKRGNYERNPSPDILSGRFVRLGAYGDPAAVSIDVWKRFLYDVSMWTGYTHQWRKPYAQDLKEFCMASCESKQQFARAHSMGWRTFRLRRDLDDKLLSNEIVCPASEEAGKKLQCVDCRACNGGRNSKVSVAIVAHGPIWKRQRIVKTMDAMAKKKKHLGIFA